MIYCHSNVVEFFTEIIFKVNNILHNYNKCSKEENEIIAHNSFKGIKAYVDLNTVIIEIAV